MTVIKTPGLSDSRRRAVAVKRFSTAQQVRHYLVDRQGGAAWTTLFGERKIEVAHYLMGIRLYEGHYEQAKTYLATPQHIPELEEGSFAFEKQSLER